MPKYRKHFVHARIAFFVVLPGVMAILVLLALGCSSIEEKRQSFYEAGQVLFEKGQYKKASLELKNSVKVDSKFAKGYALLGRCYLKLGEWRQAFANLNKAVELDPTLLQAQTLIGLFYLRSGRLEEAGQKTRLVLKEDPDHVDARLLQSLIQARQDQTDKAVAGLQKLIAQHPDNEKGYRILARIYEKDQDMKQAVEVLKQGFQALPKSRSLRMQLIESLGKRGQTQEAEAHFQILLAQNPDSKELHLKHIEFLTKAGLTGNAIQETKRLVDKHPEVTDYRLRLARLHLERQEQGRAEAVLKEGMNSLKQPFELQLALGDVKSGQGEIKAAEELFTTLATKAETQAKKNEARLRLARLYLEQNKLSQAANEIKTVRGKDPNNIQACYFMGRVYLKRNNPSEAIVELRQVVREQPEMLDASMVLAQAHFQNNEPQNAVQVLSQALKQEPEYTPAREALIQYYLRHRKWPQAEKHLQIVVKQHPEKINYLVTMGDVQLHQGKTDQAGQVFEAIQISDGGYRALGTLKLAQLAVVEKNTSRALELFEQALQLDENFLPAVAGRINILMEQDRKKEALDFCRNLTRKHPENAIFHVFLGQAALNTGRIGLAETHLLHASRQEPNWLIPYVLLGEAYAQDGRTKEAIARLEEAQKQQPDSTRLSFILGHLYQKQGDLDKARVRYEAILTKQPEFLPAINNLAYLLADTGQDLEKALKLAEKAAAQSDAKTLDTLGWVHHKLGNREMALKYLHQAKELAVTDESIAEHLEAVLQSEG